MRKENRPVSIVGIEGFQRRPEDRAIRWRIAIAMGGTALVTFLVSHVLARTPALAERLYGTGFWPLISRPIARLTGLLPFALHEWLAFFYALYLAIIGFRGMRAAIGRRRRWANALAAGAHRIVRHASVLIVLFYVLWGFNYARPTFEARAGWPDWDGIEPAELINLTETAVLAANAAYRELHGTDDAGAPTPFPAEAGQLEAALDTGWTRAAAQLDLPRATARPFGRVKQPLVSPILGRLGIVGVYVPFTAEANVLRGMPAMRAPTSMAHEMAHQRGVTTEAEATFLGLIAAALAPDPLARYSAAVSASGHLAGALLRVDADALRRISAIRLPGIRRDQADLEAYFERFEGPAQQVGTAINDRYLRANRIPGGTANYGRAIRLLITYSRLHGPGVLPDRPAPK